MKDYIPLFFCHLFLCIAAFHATQILSSLPLSLPQFHSTCLQAVRPTLSCYMLKYRARRTVTTVAFFLETGRITPGFALATLG